MKKITIVLILFTLALTACGSADARANTRATQKIAAATPVETDASGRVFAQQGDTTPTTEAAIKGQALLAAGAVIAFQRSGGFAGVSEQWIFFADGRITNDKGDQKTVEADQVTALLDELEAVGFFEMKIPSDGGKLSTCKDCFTYQITATNGEKLNTVTIIEGATGVPEAFWKIINKLSSMVAIQ